MTNRIKVVPNTPDAVGMRHPHDGALKAEGSLWAYDTFTLQRLFAGSIRHAEEGGEASLAPAEAGEDVPPTASKPARGQKGAGNSATGAV